MTPMAARLFRTGGEVVKSALAVSQFLEVTALNHMAAEMVDADIAAGCTVFSEFAQLPAPVTTIEYVMQGTRIMLLCDEHADAVRYVAFYEEDGVPRPKLMGGFRPGTSDHLPGEWLEPAYAAGPNPPTIMSATDPRMVVMTSITSALEKYLCIINQPGLIEHRERTTDKRVLKEAKKIGKRAPVTWHECRIRVGCHSGTATATSPADEPVMPLHYVRKYFKPSVQKWVDGYWRGDIALGLHLKWYSPRPPQLNGERIAA